MSGNIQTLASTQIAAGGGGLAFDAASSSSQIGNSDLVFAHTTSGSDRVMVVGVSVNAMSVTAVTYNGVGLTLIDSQVNGSVTVYQYGLIAPATGSNNISVSLSGPPSYCIAGGVTYTGAHQTTAFGTSAKATGSDTTPTVDVTSAATEVVIDTVSWRNNDVTATAGAGQTQRWNINDLDDDFGCACSTETGAATTTMSWTLSGSSGWTIVGTPIKPA